MKIEERERRAKLMEKWAPYFTIACTLLGTMLGTFLVYVFQDTFPYEVLAGGLTGALILIGIQLVKQQTKRDRTPEVDERTIRNLFRFYAIASFSFLGLLFVSLAALTLLGNESVPLLYLWLFFFSYIWFIGIGAIITKRR